MLLPQVRYWTPFGIFFFFSLKWQKSKEMAQYFGFTTALAAACFPYPYQYWRRASAEEDLCHLVRHTAV